MYLIIVVNSQFGENTPPTMWIEPRTWNVAEDEVIGSKVAQVQADDSDNDTLVYSLELIAYRDPKRARPGLPFKIDPHTGVVKLNESLEGRVSNRERLRHLFSYLTMRFI